MPTLRYKGSYGSSVNLTQPRTAELTAEDEIPTAPIVVLSAYVRVYISTTNKGRTYHYSASIDGGYTGALEYRFASVDNPVYENIPLTVTPQDPAFPIRNITAVTVSETGSYGDSTRIRGTVRVFVEYAYVNAPTAPSNLLLNGQTAINLQADYPAQLTWTAGAAGAYDTFLYYRVMRQDPLDQSITILGTTTETQYMITAPYEDSRSYYYYVQTVCLYRSATAANYASIYTFIPLTEPTFLTPNPYNPRPMVLVQLGDGPRDDLLTLVADGWTQSRRAYPNRKIYLKRNSSYTSAKTETVVVTETDEMVRSITADLDIDYSPAVYTQPSVIAGTTIVKAADITELQEALATIRDGYGMEETEFTPCVSGVTSLELWQTHIAELHDCIREIQTFVNSWDTDSGSYAIILPTLITSFGPSAAVINQLRKIVTML